MTDVLNTNRLRISIFDAKRVAGYSRRSATGCWAVEVDITDIEVTNMDDDRPRFRRWPRVVVKEKPGSEWG